MVVVETVCKHCHVVVRMRLNADGTTLILHPEPLCEGARRTVEEAGGVIERLAVREREKPSTN
jgi:hypothetical protein